jgi:hypothetical protein
MTSQNSNIILNITISEVFYPVSVYVLENAEAVRFIRVDRLTSHYRCIPYTPFFALCDKFETVVQDISVAFMLRKPSVRTHIQIKHLPKVAVEVVSLLFHFLAAPD